MYSEWFSLSEGIRNDESGRSALSVYPSSVGRDVAKVVIKNLVDNPTEQSKTRFKCSEDVKWTMHVICFGLGLPLSEGETLKGCVTIYLDWLSSLSSQPKQEVPEEILKDPNMYCQRILQHFKNLFVPKTEGTLALQASLCMKVLQGVQRISHECKKMDERTLKVMLQFLLSISDFLLSPPFVPGGLTEQLCRLLIEVLFDVWLQACVWAFPDPPLWNTLQEMCCTWRHHTDFVALWNKTVFSITRRVLLVEYGSGFPLYPLDDKKHEIRIPTTLDNKCLIQSWFRFLHIMGNPVDLSSKEIIGNTPKFKEHMLVNSIMHQPSEHSCLHSMPQNFYAAMKGIATLVDTLLGEKCSCETPVMFNLISPENITMFPMKNDAKHRVQIAVSTDQLANFTRDMDWKLPGRLENQTGYLFDKTVAMKSPLMPMENSILHLLGSWLFEATLTHVNIRSVKMKLYRTWQRYLIQSDHERSSDSDNQNIGDEGYKEFEQGRAEAFGALCRIFCSQRSGLILPVYLSRFYFSLAAGLIFDKSCSGHVLSSILLNSTDLLRVNLPGVDVVIPHLIAALEKVLGQNEITMGCDVPMVQLQRAAIHLLLSMLCLPSHFRELTIADVSVDQKLNKKADSHSNENVTFLSLKSKLIKLLICALENENDSHNTQLLLGGVMLCVQDSALVEEEHDFIPPQSPGPKHLNETFSVDGQEFNDSEREIKKNFSDTEGGKSSNDNGLNQNMPEDMMKKDCAKNNLCLRGYTASALFSHLTNLINQKLIFGSKWKTDFHVTLSAFELMTEMAEINIQDISKQECQKTIKWLCDYVEYQAKQPAPFHSRDLHSMMVAAFKCLLTWITSHPWLLDDQKSLQAILEVVELGISGTKSKASENQDVTTEVISQPKGEKSLKPASFRVREAAESVLSCIMEHVGAFPSPCGPASSSSLIDEDILMEFLPEDEQNKRFHYFVVDDSIIIGVLQESIHDHDGLSPTATILLRGPTGRTSWTVDLRQIPECKKESLGVCQSEAPKRPNPNLEISLLHQCIRPHFPADVETVSLTKANSSVPAVENISCEKLTQDKDFIQNLIDKQREEENNAQGMIEKEREKSMFPCPLTEMKPLKSVNEFSASRMILAQLGLLKPDEYEKVRSMDTSSTLTSLSPLNSSEETFFESLKELDHLPTRCFDTVYVLYVKRGQRDAKSILTNEIKHCEYKDMFYEFLQTLGWPVEVQEHPGWTGNPTSSWKLSYLKNQTLHEDTNPSNRSTVSSHGSESDSSLTAVHEEHTTSGSGSQDGSRDGEDSKSVPIVAECHRIMYYANSSTEIAFIVPSLFPRVSKKRKKSRQTTPRTKRKAFAMKRPQSITNLPSTTSSTSSLLYALPETRGLSLSRNTADTGIDLRYLSKLNTHSTSSEINILVIWLEKFLDHELFPNTDILNELGINKESTMVSSPSGKPVERETAMIFIAPLHNGLFRIHTKCTIKSPMAGPLVDGMVVSQRSLGAMVRHTAVNIGRRRRLDIDNYSPPHVYRKLKIQDIIRKCRRNMSFPEFYASLFAD